jgi:monoamine oxidase
MRRRQLLTLPSLGLAISPAMSHLTAHAQTNPAVPPRRALVIGAGLAGLAAANRLQQQGYEVRVLEARSRVGGRIWTSTQWPDMPLDLGATWIHGVKGNPLTALADTLQAKRLSTSYARSVTYATSGKVMSADQDQHLNALRNRIAQTLRQAQQSTPDKSIRQALAPLYDTQDEVPENRRLLDFLLSSEFETEYAGSASHLSVHWFDSVKELKGGDVLFAQGFHTLTQHLAKSVTIELGQVVQGIDWHTSPVQVTTQTGRFVADKVLITVPLGVLKQSSLQFTPALPNDKQMAIDKLGMGVLNKCYLRFQKPFWPADVDWLEAIPAEHGRWTEWVSFQRAAQWPVLLGFNAADSARDMEAWSDARVVNDAMHTLRTIFGPSLPEPIDFQITRWAQDPFAMGSYSYNALGATPTLRQDLARPLRPSLFFAGEATEKDTFGTAHGAYLSGLRAAKEVFEGS